MGGHQKIATLESNDFLNLAGQMCLLRALKRVDILRAAVAVR